MANFEQATQCLEQAAAKGLTPAELVAAAQVYALLALVEIVEVFVAAQLTPPPPDPEPEPPFEQTREGWTWDV